MKQRTLALRQIYSEGTALLEQAGIDEASLDAWYLLEYVTGISRASYYGDPDRELAPEQVERYLECIRIRKTRVPLQHITGEQEFMGYPFYVNKHVLIPRQDTEVLVEEAVRLILRDMDDTGTKKDEKRTGTAGNGSTTDRDILPDRQYQILDMCTGSGCILLSILKMCPGVSGIGCDISEEALAVARKNAERLGCHNVRKETTVVQFFQGDLFDALNQNEKRASDRAFDLIVSNPPYIRTAEIEELQEEVRLHDPRIALDGREDGLYFYRKIIRDSIHYLAAGGYLMLEIGCNQAEAVTELMNARGYKDIIVKKDLAGLDRVVMGRYYLY